MLAACRHVSKADIWPHALLDDGRPRVIVADPHAALVFYWVKLERQIRVSGPVGKGSDVRAAVARSRERAKLLGGSVEVKVARGQAGALASLPVLG